MYKRLKLGSLHSTGWLFLGCLALPQEFDFKKNWMCELVYLKPQNVFRIEDGDIPASYVSLPEGNCQFFLRIPHLEHQIQAVLKVAGWK